MTNNQSSIVNRQSSIIRVLVVDDSPVTREFLVHILSSDPEIQVIGTASNGEEAVEFTRKNKPDVITMDIHMPGMNGFEATRTIMETDPLPIVIVSASWNPEEVQKTFLCMEAGAITALAKPPGIGHPEYEKRAEEIITTVKLMSEVKVVKRYPRLRYQKPLPLASPKVEKRGEIKIIAIGASTGGPPALQSILSGLSKDISVPVLIVQHIAKGFLTGLVEWLGHTTGFPIHIGNHGKIPLPGHVYFAPEDLQMGVDNSGRIALSKDDPINNVRPSASYLFRSISNIFREKAIGVLLTGMGKDGAVELRLMKMRGAITIAQDKDTSVVHGMPGEAIKLDGATYVLPIDRIYEMLESLVSKTFH